MLSVVSVVGPEEPDCVLMDVRVDVDLQWFQWGEGGLGLVPDI